MQPLLQTNRIFMSLVKEINRLIHEDVIVTNENGIIVASTSLKRVGEFHEGAYLTMKNNEKMIMTEKLSQQLKGVRKGIVLPIMMEGKPIAVLGITGDPVKVEPFARIVKKMAELFIQGTIDQMTEEKMARNIELFVFDWINENIPEDLLLRRSEFFNIDLKKYNQVISIHFSFTGNDLSYRDIAFLRTQWDQKSDALFIRWGQGKLLIIDKEHERNMLRSKINMFLEIVEEQFDMEVCIGVGQPSSSSEISISYNQAERACIIAQKEQQVIFEEELRFEMVQYAIDKKTKKRFIGRTIRPLIEDDITLQTLRSWLENDMSIQKTAEALHIHKNTLYYRLEKIKNLTNLNTDKLDHVVLLYLGNRFLQDRD